MQIECDNCERLINVPADHDKPKIACPYCGDVNRIPENVNEVADADAPAERDSGGEEAPVNLPPKTEAERTICVLRPAMGRAHPFQFGLMIVLGLGGIVLAIMSRAGESVPPWALWPGLMLLAVSIIWWIGWWCATRLWLKLTVSNKRTIRQEGIIQRHTTEVLHDHVRSVDIQQSLTQRIFNVGTVGIDSAGQDDVEIVMRNIPRPYEVKKIIDQYRKM